MRIVKESKAELVLEHRPIVFPVMTGVLAAAVLVQTLRSADSLTAAQWTGAITGIAVGVIIGYLMALPSRVVFDSVGREVRWQHKGWPGRDQGRCPLQDVTDVQVLSDSPNGGPERVTLLTSKGLIPLTRDFRAFEPHQQTASVIRKWLRVHGYELLAA